MRVREMHPLCCITLASGAIGDQSPEPAETTAAMLLRTGSAVVGSDANAGGSEATSVAGVLYKWTNYHKGWRSRWFNLRNGVLSYSKTCHPDHISFAADDVKLIGLIPSDDFGRRKHRKTIRIVHLKEFTIGESKRKGSSFWWVHYSKQKTFPYRQHNEWGAFTPIATISISVKTLLSPLPPNSIDI